MQRRVGTTKELWSISTTQQGTYLMIYFEAQDTEKVTQDFARSLDPFDVWMKTKFEEITGFYHEVIASGPPQNVLTYGY